jgi:protein required for attachment to host cells
VKLAIERELEHPNPPTHDQGTSPPGRFIGGVSGSRSAVEQTDWHRLEQERFAHEIAADLYRLAHANVFYQLVVVAPPKVLGNLRAAFHEEVRKRLLAEIPKDLTEHSTSEIARLLSI